MLDFGMLFLSMGACFFLGLSVLFVRGRTDCHLVGVVCFIYRRTCMLALWCWPNLSSLEIRLKSQCSFQHFTILAMEITLFTMSLSLALSRSLSDYTCSVYSSHLRVCLIYVHDIPLLSTYHHDKMPFNYLYTCLSQ